MDKKQFTKTRGRARRLHGPTSETTLDEVTTYLNNQLESVGLDGEVVALLVYDGHGRINNYGMRLDDGMVWRYLNETIATEGTSLTGTTSSPPIKRLTSYEKGYFVSASQFKKEVEQDKYVALINIKLGFEATIDDAVRFG